MGKGRVLRAALICMMSASGCSRRAVGAALPALELGIRATRRSSTALAFERSAGAETWDTTLLVRLVFRAQGALWQPPARVELSPAADAQPCLDADCTWSEADDALGSGAAP